MSELTKERIQQIWDYELINGWDESGKNKMGRVIYHFMKKIEPEIVIYGGDFNIEDYLVKLNLNRCLDIDRKNDCYIFKAFKTDVIGFIHARCERLSLDLINDMPKPLILLGINDYTWTKKNATAYDSNRRSMRNKTHSDKATRTIRARDLTGSNWNKVS